MNDLDPRALRVLRAILEERNLTRAAARLGMGQPAASAVLARMRRALGDPLLVRSGREMVLTERAVAALPQVVRILEDLKSLTEPPTDFDPASAVFDVTIAAIDYVQAAVLPGFLERLGRQAPGIRVAVRPMVLDGLAEQLERGVVDLAILPRGNAPGHLRSRVLAEERFACAVRRDHPDAGRALDLDTYCRLSHVLVAPTRHDFSGQVDRALAKQGRTRHVRVSVPSFFAAVEIVRRSDDVATVPARLAAQFAAELTLHPPPLPVEGFTLALAWHERLQHSPSHAWLRDRLTPLAPI